MYVYAWMYARMLVCNLSRCACIHVPFAECPRGTEQRPDPDGESHVDRDEGTSHALHHIEDRERRFQHAAGHVEVHRDRVCGCESVGIGVSTHVDKDARTEGRRVRLQTIECVAF